jgi:hypothetical protein
MIIRVARNVVHISQLGVRPQLGHRAVAYKSGWGRDLKDTY